MDPPCSSGSPTALLGSQVYPSWLSKLWEWTLVQGARYDMVQRLVARRQWISCRCLLYPLLFQVCADLEYLATTPGGTNYETTQLNIESLWSGGPFADPVCLSSLPLMLHPLHDARYQTYNGGNKQPFERNVMAQALEDIRQRIFRSPTGGIDSEYLSFLLRFLSAKNNHFQTSIS